MLCPYSIQRWYSNPRPSEHESPPMTTRPGLMPYLLTYSLAYLLKERAEYFQVDDDDEDDDDAKWLQGM